MVPTQESPRSSFSCPRWAADNQGPTAPRNGNMSHPPRRMKFNPGRSQFLSLQLLSVYIHKFSQKGVTYRNNWQKNEALSSVYFIFRRIFNGLVRLFRWARKRQDQPFS